MPVSSDELRAKPWHQKKAYKARQYYHSLHEIPPFPISRHRPRFPVNQCLVFVLEGNRARLKPNEWRIKIHSELLEARDAAEEVCLAKLERTLGFDSERF